NRVAFNQYAIALRQTAQTMLTAIDAHDPKALVKAGGVLDEVCESCHTTFWYPVQTIPSFPHKGDPGYDHIAVNPTKSYAAHDPSAHPSPVKSAPPGTHRL